MVLIVFLVTYILLIFTSFKVANLVYTEKSLKDKEFGLLKFVSAVAAAEVSYFFVRFMICHVY